MGREMDTIQPDTLRTLLDQNKARLRHSKSYSPVPGVTRQAWWVDEHPVQEGGSGTKGHEISKAQYEALAREYPHFVDNEEFRKYRVNALKGGSLFKDLCIDVVAECVEQALALAASDYRLEGYTDLLITKQFNEPVE